MLTADEIEKEIQESEQKYLKNKKKYSDQKDQLLQQKNKMEEQKKDLLQKKEELKPKIPDDQIKLYTRIYSSKYGIALSPVTDDFCSMCHMRIRPQMLNELKEGNKIILCENCGRILYWLKKSD